MTTPSPPDVHRVYTRSAPLGYVDNGGVYHFPGGGKVLANGDYIDPSGSKLGTSVVVAEDAARLSGRPVRDAAFPEDNEARAKHHVDARYQSTYDADPDTYAGNPLAVFTVTDAGS